MAILQKGKMVFHKVGAKVIILSHLDLEVQSFGILLDQFLNSATYSYVKSEPIPPFT